MKRGTLSFFSLIVLAISSIGATVAGLNILREEPSFVNATSSRNVRVSWFPMEGMQNVDSSDPANPVYSGYTYEYLKAVCQFTGWTLTPVDELTRDESLLNLAKTGDERKIDLCNFVPWSQDSLDNYCYFSDSPSGTDNSIFLARVGDSRYSYGAYESFNGAVIGYSSDSRLARLSSWQATHPFTADHYTKYSEPLLLQALEEGTIDLALVSKTDLYSGAFRSVLSFDYGPFYFAVAKEETAILAELNMAMNQIFAVRPNFNVEMMEKYFGIATGVAPTFTEEEKAYLATDGHSNITIGYDPNWEPIEYYDADAKTMKGVMASFYQAVAKKSGLTFTYVASDTFLHTLRDYGDQIDVFSSLSFDFDNWEKYNFLLTQPLATLQVEKVFRSTEGKRAACPAGYYMETLLKRTYSESDGYSFVTYDSTDECLDAIVKGDADFTFMTSLEFSFYLSLPAYKNLLFSLVSDKSIQLSSSVSTKANPLLYSIMVKCVSSISSTEMAQFINENSVHDRTATILEVLSEHPWAVGLVSAAFVVAIAFLVYFLAKARIERRESKKLEHLNAELARVNQAQSDFLSRMSHDIRTPLNGIMGMTTIALDESNSPKTQDCLNKIILSSDYLLGLVNDVLDMKKIESSSFFLKKEPYPYEELGQYLEGLIAPLCEKKRQNFIVKIPVSVERVPLVDKLRFNQIVFNLLSNAQHYTPEGGTVEFLLRVTSKGPDIDVAMTVKDNGIGMSPEFQKTMFEPFTQEDKSRPIPYAGTNGSSGLGLAIVKRLVEAMKGTISFTSVQGVGTTFNLHFLFPSAPLPHRSDTMTNLKPSTSFSLAGKRVLLAEDNLINQEVAKAIFEKVGASVAIAADGLWALKMFESSQPGTFALIAMDIRMPNLDGYGATKAIRALDRPDAKAIPIIAMTADAFGEDAKKCLEAGMDAHVAKPLYPDVVYKVVEKTIAIKEKKVAMGQL